MTNLGKVPLTVRILDKHKKLLIKQAKAAGLKLSALVRLKLGA